MRMRRKPWTEIELGECPFFIDRPSAQRGHWRERFPDARPIQLEIGCGKGVSTVKMAHDNPDINFIAIDEVRHVLAVSARNAQAEYGGAPRNLLLSAVDAMTIHDTFAPSDGIERVYIHFCNPWDERAKHHKRRLTHPRQLRQYRGFLAPGGEIRFKTDNDALFTATKRYLGECGFEIAYLTEDLHASGFAPNYVSEHEQLYVSQGRPIRFLIARMAPIADRKALLGVFGVPEEALPAVDLFACGSDAWEARGIRNDKRIVGEEPDLLAGLMPFIPRDASQMVADRLALGASWPDPGAARWDPVSGTLRARLPAEAARELARTLSDALFICQSVDKGGHEDIDSAVEADRSR